jgi:GTP-dependent phosphoenolpyruvate carboxykinase
VTSDADHWWAGLSPERRAQVYRFLGPRHEPPTQDEVLPFAAPGVAHRPAVRRFITALASTPQTVTLDRGWIVVAGRRWQKRTVSDAVAAGAVVFVGDDLART